LITGVLAFLGARLIYKFNKVSKRLTSFISKSRSELIDIYLDMFNNLTMLRNLDKKNYFKSRFYKKTDEFQVASTCLNNHSMRWLGLRISIFLQIVIVLVLGLPMIVKLYFKKVYLIEKWHF
jgi:hypothetical protein